MFTKKSLALAIAILAPMAANAQMVKPESTFRLSTGATTSSVLYDDKLTYRAGDLTMTFQAFKADGQKIAVSQQGSGIGARDKGDIWDLAQLGSEITATAGEYLTITFNKEVRINSLTMSDWQWGWPDNNGDNASLHWEGGSRFMNNEMTGYEVFNQSTVWFDLVDDEVIGSTFTLRNMPNTIQARTGFYLAGINVTAVAPVTAVPEPATYALMGLGLAGILLAKRRRRG